VFQVVASGIPVTNSTYNSEISHLQDKFLPLREDISVPQTATDDNEVDLLLKNIKEEKNVVDNSDGEKMVKTPFVLGSLHSSECNIKQFKMPSKISGENQIAEESENPGKTGIRKRHPKLTHLLTRKEIHVAPYSADKVC